MCDVSIILHRLQFSVFLVLIQAENKQSQANELTMDSVGGVFVVLIAGMGVACAISVMEYLWKGGSLERKVNMVKVNNIFDFLLFFLVQSEAQFTGCPGSLSN